MLEIHLAVSGPGLARITTLIYIVGEPLNERDGVLMGGRDPAARAASSSRSARLPNRECPCRHLRDRHPLSRDVSTTASEFALSRSGIPHRRQGGRVGIVEASRVAKAALTRNLGAIGSRVQYSALRGGVEIEDNVVGVRGISCK